MNNIEKVAKADVFYYNKGGVLDPKAFVFFIFTMKNLLIKQIMFKKQFTQKYY